MMSQDSSEPDGVAGPRGKKPDTKSVTRARQRKSNAAISMKIAGASWDEIAIALGYPTPRAALVATEKALERQLRDEGDKAAMRSLAGARLNRLLRAAMPKALDDKHPEQLTALTKCREIIAQHSKLFGLDAPTEVVVHNPTQNEIEEWVALVLQGQAPQVEQADIIDVEVLSDDHAIPA